ncbi:MAG TPA: Trp biosynthesis-associated membrane protein [Trebonia sp.]|jgi:uncharacterized membrane protein (TIGR02234 family)
MTPRRAYTYTLLTALVGAGLIWLALREQWAKAVFTQPKPLPQQTVDVSGADLVPMAGALALAALACLAAVIATRGAWRQGVGVLLALLGAGAGAAVVTAVTAASVVSTAASKVGSPTLSTSSGVSPGSTTSGVSSGSAVVISGSAGHALMTGTSWRYAVIVGALLIFVAGLMTALNGRDWPVMSSRYELPPRRAAAGDGEPGEAAPAASVRPSDSASMWESLSGGEDPTAADTGDRATGDRDTGEPGAGDPDTAPGDGGSGSASPASATEPVS